MFSMVLRDLGSDDVVLLFASANPEWASFWIRERLRGDLVRKFYEILRHLGLALYDPSTRIWKVTRLGLETLKLLLVSQAGKSVGKASRNPRLIRAKENMRGLECLAYVLLRAEQYGLSLSRLTRPHPSRERLREALGSLSFADVAALALLDRGLKPGEAYGGTPGLVSKGFLSPKLKLRRYGVWIIRATRSYMKKKGLNPLGYTDQEWQHIWELPPTPEPKSNQHPQGLKVKAKLISKPETIIVPQ